MNTSNELIVAGTDQQAATPSVDDLQELALTMMTMLNDLSACYGWDELCATLEAVTSDAQALGVLAPVRQKTAISIGEDKFIGQGRNPFLVSGRVSGDDDDTCYLILADDIGAAEATFRAQLLHDGGLDDGEGTIYIVGSETLA